MIDRLPDGLPCHIKAYCAIKQRIAPIGMLRGLTPEHGRVLDVGCGLGFGAWIMARDRPGLFVKGLDIDAAKIAMAKRYFSTPNMEFEVQDIADFETTDAYDAVVVSDVFYLIPYALQEEMLAKACSILKPGGAFILKEMAAAPRWKYWMNILQETIAVRIAGFTFGDEFYFRPVSQYRELIEKHRMSCEELPVKGYCYPHVYYVGRFPDAPVRLKPET